MPWLTNHALGVGNSNNNNNCCYYKRVAVN